MLKNLAYILLLAVLLAGCRSHKQAVAPSVDAAAFAKLSPKKQREAVEKSFIPWQWAYIPANVSISSPASISGGGRLTMQRDSLIHLSLRVLGMEVAVLYADSDSVYAVDKFHKYFLAESLDRIMASSGLSLGDIQDLLLGQALPPPVRLCAPPHWPTALCRLSTSTSAAPTLCSVASIPPMSPLRQAPWPPPPKSTA